MSANRKERAVPIVLDGRRLTIVDVVHAAREKCPVELADHAWDQIRRGREHVDDALREGAEAYGVTTGVGSQKTHSVDSAEIDSFNRRLLVAHATTASSKTLSKESTRAALVCLLNSLASGLSGVRITTVKRLLQALEHDDLPALNSGASVGASDLVPLAQLATSILGLSNPLGPSEATRKPNGSSEPLAAKEALSLMNSNAISLGHGALVLVSARKLLRSFDLSLALALEGFRGNTSILHPAVVKAHPQRGQRTSTQHLRRLMRGGCLLDSESEARNLQDPLSFRCGPQIQGATYETLEWVWRHWEIELNAVADNPVVDLDGGRLISHGNMDTSLLAIATDALRSALANVVGASAQRIHKLHWPAFSGLPSGLTANSSAVGGVQFLNLSHLAEAHAASVRSKAQSTLFSYQGQLADGVEDHASMLPLAIAETEALIDLAWVVQAIELTIASWAIRRRGLSETDIGEGLRDVYQRVEAHLPIGREGAQVFDLRPVVEMSQQQIWVDLIDDEAPPGPETYVC